MPDTHSATFSAAVQRALGLINRMSDHNPHDPVEIHDAAEGLEILLASVEADLLLLGDGAPRLRNALMGRVQTIEAEIRALTFATERDCEGTLGVAGRL